MGPLQGGGTVLRAGMLADDYAPDAGVVGVAGLAPAANLVSLMSNIDNVTGGSIFVSNALEGYASTYDDVDIDDYVRGAAQVQVDEMAERYLSDPGALLNFLERLTQDTSGFSTEPTSDALGARLAQNVLTGPISAPVLLAPGDDDELVIPSAQRAYREQLHRRQCRAAPQIPRQGPRRRRRRRLTADR